LRRLLAVALLLVALGGGLYLLTEETTTSASAATTLGGGTQPARVRLPVPRAITASPVEVHATYALLVGKIDPRNGLANYEFEIGRTKRYGRTLELSDGEYVTGNGFQKVTELATRLKAGTTYHFRVVASNHSGFADGGDRKFDTPRQ
jgi:hypothetical protein